MKPCRLLYLDPHKVCAYLWQNGRLKNENCFEATPAGQEDFGNYLGQHRDCLFHLLSNAGDEAYQIETIPFLHGRDRQHLLQRKLNQYFFGTPLTASQSLGYERDTRRNERVLLSALTKIEQLTPWLGPLDRYGTALSGIYTLGQIAPILLERNGTKPPRCLLLSIQDKSLHESFIVDGNTWFSRVTPLSDSSYAGIASSFASEAPKLQQYLIGQRLLSRNEKIPVYLIAPSAALETVNSACQQQPELEFRVIDSAQLANRIGLTPAPESFSCETLFLHLLATSPPKTQYATALHRHRYQVNRLRTVLWSAGLLSLCAALLFSAERLLNAHRLEQESAQTSRLAQEKKQHYQAISTTFPELPIGKEAMRQLMPRIEDLSNNTPWPASDLQWLSEHLSRFPPIEIDVLEWKPPPAGATDKGRILTVEGHLRSGKLESVRQVLNGFQQFVSALESSPEITLRVLEQPYEIDPGKPLRSTDQPDDQPIQRPFALQITRRSTP